MKVREKYEGFTHASFTDHRIDISKTRFTVGKKNIAHRMHGSTDKEKQKRGSGRRRRKQLKEDCARTYRRIVIYFR